jgi:putative PEP-CTERM system TPR-repeat lipoprotein
MRKNNLFSRSPISALLLALLLTSCGEKPESMLNSAKDYLAKNDAKAAVIQVKNALQANPDLPEARFLLGKALLETGDSVGAETELRKALALKVPQDQVVPLLAKAILAQGQARKVSEEFGNISLTNATAFAELQTSLASAFAAQGQTALYSAALTAALGADANYEPALLLQIRQKVSLGDVDGAMTGVDAVVAKSPKNYEAWKLKGDMLQYLKNKPDDALAAFRKSAEVRPDFIQGHASAVRVLFQQNRLEEADKQLAGMKAIAPSHPQTQFFEAQLAYQRKDFKLARSLSQQVLKSAPNYALGLQLAGAIELALNSPLQAENYLSKALQFAPQLPIARRLLTATYARTGNMAKAIATMAPGLSRDPVDPELLSLAGEVYLQSGDAKKAEEFFAKAIKQDPQNARRRTALAVSQLMAGNADSAFNELEQIAISDKGTVADMALISAHLRRNEFDKALKAIDALEKKQPGKPGAAILQGRTYLAKKDHISARKSFERALGMEPTFFPAVASLAGLDMAEKKPEDAKKRFEALLAIEPKNGQALLALAELAARSGANKDEVAKLINNAVAANPEEVAPRLLLINFHLNNKDTKQALSAAQGAQTAVPDSPELLDALGRTQQATGDFNQAITTYNKLAALQPMSPQPHMRLADVHMAAKNKEAAAQSLRKALEIKPDLQQAQRGSILLDVDEKNYQNALTTARSMQSQEPNQAIGYVLEGDINATEKKWDAAGNAYRKGLKQIASPELAIKLHSVMMASGKAAEADQFVAKWQKDQPKDSAFLLYLADGAIGQKDYPLAERNYQAVLKLQPNNAVAYNNLAWVTAKLNKDGAIAYAEKALAISPNQPAFMDTLAGLLSDKNESAKALEMQKKVVALQPDAPLFKLNLAKIQIKAGDKAGAKVTLGELAKLGDKFGGQAEVASLLTGL